MATTPLGTPLTQPKHWPPRAMGKPQAAKLLQGQMGGLREGSGKEESGSKGRILERQSP